MRHFFSDPLVAQKHRIQQRLLKRAGGDLHAYAALLRGEAALVKRRYRTASAPGKRRPAARAGTHVRVRRALARCKGSLSADMSALRQDRA
jgi:hypothetical protein